MLEQVHTATRSAAKPLPANRLARAHRLRDGRLIGYAEYGDPDGRPVIALHGTPASRLLFRLGDGPARARGLRLIAPDRPGYGLSSPNRLRTLAFYPPDIAELADALGVERFAMLAVSGGGPYGAACAARLAQRVAALGLVSPVGPLAPWDGLHLSLAHRFVFHGLGGNSFSARLMFLAMRAALARAPAICHRGIVERAAPSDRPALLRREVRDSLLEAMSEGLRPGVEGACQDMRLFAQPWQIDLSCISAKSQVWIGTADRQVPVAAAERLAALIPNCGLQRREGAGHYWVFDHFQDVLDWVERHCPAGQP